MQLPLHIVQIGDSRVTRIAKTSNISTAGVGFVSDDVIEVGERIEYIITLLDVRPPVRIRCLGKVVRCVKRDESAEGFEVAATMDRYQFVRSDELFESPAVSA